MRVETCNFCSRPCYPSKGITFCRNDGAAFRFCRSKCHKNFKMKRNPRKLAWTKAFRSAHAKEMVVDPTLQLAARRNVPVRYSRAHVATTLQAMSRVAEIRARRERAQYRVRMRGNRARQRDLDRRLVAEHPGLLPRERGSYRVEREAALESELVGSLEQGLEGLGSKIDKGSRLGRKEFHRLRLLRDGGVEGGEADDGFEDFDGDDVDMQ